MLKRGTQKTQRRKAGRAGRGLSLAPVFEEMNSLDLTGKRRKRQWVPDPLGGWSGPTGWVKMSLQNQENQSSSSTEAERKERPEKERLADTVHVAEVTQHIPREWLLGVGFRASFCDVH